MDNKTTRRSLFQGLRDLLHRLAGSGQDPELPGDPYAYRGAPVRRGPNSRGSTSSAADPHEKNRTFPPQRT